MKKIILFFIVVISFSCSSSDDGNDLQLSKSELLILNSPWKLTHFEVLEITESNNPDINALQLQANLNNSLDMVTIRYIFNDDGTGTAVTDDHIGNDTHYSNFTWSILSDGQLQKDEVSYPFTVNNNELVITGQNGQYIALNTEITYNAKLYFNKLDI